MVAGAIITGPGLGVLKLVPPPPPPHLSAAPGPLCSSVQVTSVSEAAPRPGESPQRRSSLSPHCSHRGQPCRHVAEPPRGLAEPQAGARHRHLLWVGRGFREARSLPKATQQAGSKALSRPLGALGAPPFPVSPRTVPGHSLPSRRGHGLKLEASRGRGLARDGAWPGAC